MPITRHRHRRIPRAHWILLILALATLFVALVLDGLARHPGGGTGWPDPNDPNPKPPTGLGSVVFADGEKTASWRLPDRTMALTFDDGPDPVWTPKVLDILKQHQIKATFFVIGAKVNQHPELVRRMIMEGHEVGIHTFSHGDLAGMPEWRAQAEIDMGHNAIVAATGRQVRLLRPPYSSQPNALDGRSWKVVQKAGKSGYLTVLADIDTNDWQRPGVRSIVHAVRPPDDRGAVVLMHDGGGDRAETVTALGQLLPRLTTAGWRFTTVSAGLGQSRADTMAPPESKVRGRALAGAQTAAHHVANALKLLLIVAVSLALIRLALQLVAAARHVYVVRNWRRRVTEGGPPKFVRDPVTVIVPAYNEAANIAATVRSILATHYPLEVIVVDDGSTDGTAEIVAAMDLPSVHVVVQPNGGKPAALNTGVRHASHDLIVIVDGDTILEPEALHWLVQAFADPRVGAVAGNTRVANRGGIVGRWQHLEYVVGFNLDRRLFDVAHCMPTVPGAIGAYRRKALTDVGGISADTLAEDTDLTMAICRAGWRVVYEDHARAWTEAPSGIGALWRQRYRWCYGTMQAMWKHRGAALERGAGGKLGRRGLAYLVLFHLLQPLAAPAVDIFLLYALAFEPITLAGLAWLAIHAAQLAVAWIALRLDKEPAGPLWMVPLQQIVYRQLIYLVVLQSLVTALLGARLRWQRPPRAGHAAKLETAVRARP